MLAAHLLRILGFGKDGVDRNARDRDVALGYAEGRKVDLCFLDGNEILLDTTAKPHGVKVKVGDNQGIQDPHSVLSLEPGDDLGGEEVSADSDIRPVPCQG